MYPFERFTERAKKVLTLAQDEAERRHHHYIGTEHLLLGLMREGEGLAAKVLKNLGLEIDMVRHTIDSVLGRSERIIIQQIIPTTRVKKVIEISFEEAKRMGHNYVGTEHILLALLIEGEGIAAHVLTDLGATLDKVRSEIDDLLTNPELEPRPADSRPPPRPRDRALAAILNAAEDAAGKERAPMLRPDHLLAAMVGRQSAPPAVLDLLNAAGVNLDLLRKRLKPPRRLTRLEAALDDLRNRKEQSIVGQDYDLAAELREEEKALREQIVKALASWQASWTAAA